MENGLRYRFGPFLLDPERRLLLRDEQEIPLYGKAFDTLLLLARHSDRLVKKDELLRDVWENRVVEENNLAQSISAARKALGDTAQPHLYIVTVPGWGYRFAAQVRVLNGSAQSARPADALPQTPSESSASAVVPANSTRRFRWLAAIALAAFVVLAGAGLWRTRFGPKILARGRFAPETPAVPAPVQARRSVAIVGFQNLSGRKEDEWISTALAEMLRSIRKLEARTAAR